MTKIKLSPVVSTNDHVGISNLQKLIADSKSDEAEIADINQRLMEAISYSQSVLDGNKHLHTETITYPHGQHDGEVMKRLQQERKRVLSSEKPANQSSGIRIVRTPQDYETIKSECQKLEGHINNLLTEHINESENTTISLLHTGTEVAQSKLDTKSNQNVANRDQSYNDIRIPKEVTTSSNAMKAFLIGNVVQYKKDLNDQKILQQLDKTLQLVQQMERQIPVLEKVEIANDISLVIMNNNNHNPDNIDTDVDTNADIAAIIERTQSDVEEEASYLEEEFERIQLQSPETTQYFREITTQCIYPNSSGIPPIHQQNNSNSNNHSRRLQKNVCVIEYNAEDYFIHGSVALESTIQEKTSPQQQAKEASSNTTSPTKSILGISSNISSLAFKKQIPSPSSPPSPSHKSHIFDRKQKLTNNRQPRSPIPSSLSPQTFSHQMKQQQYKKKNTYDTETRQHYPSRVAASLIQVKANATRLLHGEDDGRILLGSALENSHTFSASASSSTSSLQLTPTASVISTTSVAINNNNNNTSHRNSIRNYYNQSITPKKPIPAKELSSIVASSIAVPASPSVATSNNNGNNNVYPLSPSARATAIYLPCRPSAPPKSPSLHSPSKGSSFIFPTTNNTSNNISSAASNSVVQPAAI